MEIDCCLSKQCRRLAYTRYLAEGPGWVNAPPDNWTLVSSGFANSDIMDEKVRVFCNNFPSPSGENWCPLWNNLGAVEDCQEYENHMAKLRKAEERAKKRSNNGRRRKWIPKAVRKEVSERSNYNCVYCERNVNKVVKGKRLGGRIDHVVPLDQGGHETDPSNLALACHPCNSDKSNNIWEFGCRIRYYEEINVE